MCKDVENKWEREESLNMRQAQLERRPRPGGEPSVVLLLNAMGSLAGF